MINLRAEVTAMKMNQVLVDNSFDNLPLDDQR
jgi:hypothetical protein